jgi:hypothetical protein
MENLIIYSDYISTIEQWSCTNESNTTIASDITPLLINTFTAVLPPPPQSADTILEARLEGQEQGDLEDWLNGVYELVEGKEVNGRGVFQILGGEEVFMYYAKRNTPDDKRWHWWISYGRENMEAGEAAGVLKVASAALTPGQVTETWQVGDGTAWIDAPDYMRPLVIGDEAGEEEDEEQVLMAKYGVSTIEEARRWMEAGKVNTY